MKEITCEEYIESISDYEKLHLIKVETEKIYLRADIEDEENLRIEMMNFEMNISLNFTNSNSDSRNCGGKIYFIEYENYETAEKNIVKDFLYIEPNAIYLLCNEEDLKNILHKYKNKIIYAVITKNGTDWTRQTADT